jgi:ABC-type polysaccharide/polyol phosphate export permease
MNKIITYLHGFTKYKYLLSIRIRYYIKAKYKNSFLGILWSLINPLLQMIVLSIVFSAIFKSSIVNFPLYMISGKLIFDFFSMATSQSLMSVCGSASLIKKVYFPKYVLVISDITALFIISLISLIDLFLVMLVTGGAFSIYLLYAPIYLVLLYIFVLGCGLILSTLNVFFRDMQHFYGVLILMLMYLSALFYPIEIIPVAYQKLFLLNPIFHYIVGFRHATYYATAPDISNLIYCVVAALVALIIGTIVFKKNQDKFILYL